MKFLGVFVVAAVVCWIIFAIAFTINGAADCAAKHGAYVKGAWSYVCLEEGKH